MTSNDDELELLKIYIIIIIIFFNIVVRTVIFFKFIQRIRFVIIKREIILLKIFF